MKENKHKKSGIKSVLLWAASALFLLGMLIFSLYRDIGNWLIVSDPLPDCADVIFVFTGDFERIDYATILLERYPEGQLVCAKRDAERLKRRLGEEATNSNIRIAEKCQSTIEEVYYLKKFLEREALEDGTVLLVSSPYHMRRISFMVKRVIRGEMDRRVRFKYVPIEGGSVRNKREKYSEWWKESKITERVGSELLKIVYYFLVVANPVFK
ncbi:ElyC/SanA/YdcF family protein [Chitinispirillales bacterium ANBcel5]|uniref:YdcF family protein n=1 Tax=Cellulosispirillum alkaliphilum TaxID=3039283 RepID=UPI002A51D282|nr:ElyC/SanA/YdcF family protein [Chitinispirillales bacterium ANBcel5]